MSTKDLVAFIKLIRELEEHSAILTFIDFYYKVRTESKLEGINELAASLRKVNV